MGSLNKVMLIGRLGQDPETRYTQSGQAVANFSLATTDHWKDANGNSQEKTEWHSLVAWGRNADLTQNYLRKGSLVYIEGSLQTRSWDDQNTGQKRYKTEVSVQKIQFLEKRSDAGQSYQGEYQQQPTQQPYAQNSQPSAPPPPPPQPMPQQAPNPSTQPPAYIDDDVPF